MNRMLLALAAFALAGTALAKLPPPDDATKAKAAEATAKAAWQAKLEAYQLCKVQDKIAAKYKASTAKSAARPAATSPTAAASAAPTTPVAYSPAAPCIDPGPFAYAPPDQKPLETSGAHSPAATATSPPSMRPEAAKMAPKK